MFAYFDREKAYGTTTEIGVALALHKPVFVGFDPDARWRDDLWFAAQGGIGSKTGHVGPVEELWENFCPDPRSGSPAAEAIVKKQPRLARGGLEYVHR